ncbi:Ribosome-recycling factor, mitochondrial [Manis javanica]|nr:Ribosome-recycling factor, mitochondrial [Manis javanica]
MAAITASMVAELRAKTDAPMMEEEGPDRSRGRSGQGWKSCCASSSALRLARRPRVTAEGVIAAFINGNQGAMIEVNSETDFVSKNDSFIAMANAAAKLVAEQNPADVAALSALAYEQDGFGPTLEDVRKGLIGKIGENMSFRSSSVSTAPAWLRTCTVRASAWSSSSTAMQPPPRTSPWAGAPMKPVSVTSADVPAEPIERNAPLLPPSCRIREACRDRRQDGRRLGSEVPGKKSRWPTRPREGCRRQADRGPDGPKGPPTPTSRASPCTWSAKASKRRWTTSLPKSPKRPLPRPAPDSSERLEPFPLPSTTIHLSEKHQFPKPHRPTSASWVGCPEQEHDDCRHQEDHRVQDGPVHRSAQEQSCACAYRPCQPSLLDSIHVDYYGSMVPLSQVANVNLLDARTISVQPWEKSMSAKVEKAIRESDLGLNPASLGDLIRVPMPPMSEERRKEMTKLARNEGEASKIAVRNLRRDANEAVKKLVKDKEASEDDQKRCEADVQKMTDKHITEIDALVAAKEQDIMAV